MNLEEHREIVEHLEQINYQLTTQNSIRRMFAVGIVYGIGFFVGSAILATIMLGLFGPWFGQFFWIRNAFETGSSLSR